MRRRVYLSHIATAKYYDHLPLHRQLDIFEREGIHLSPSTVSNWMMAAALTSGADL
ncbi:MAG: IS66 family transposase [Bacteroides cellulosilyticus]